MRATAHTSQFSPYRDSPFLFSPYPSEYLELHSFSIDLNEFSIHWQEIQLSLSIISKTISESVYIGTFIENFRDDLPNEQVFDILFEERIILGVGERCTISFDSTFFLEIGLCF